MSITGVTPFEMDNIEIKRQTCVFGYICGYTRAPLTTEEPPIIERYPHT